MPRFFLFPIFMIIFFLILGPNSCVPSVASVTLRDAERFLIVSNSFPTPKTNIFIPNAWKLRKEFVSLQHEQEKT